MKMFAAREAKNHLGRLMDEAQRQPVVIEKNGRPFAVVLSVDDYRHSETLKLEALQCDLQAGIDQADRGELLDSDKVFSDLEQW